MRIVHEAALVYNGAETALYNLLQLHSLIHSWARFLHISADLHQAPEDFSGTESEQCTHVVLCRALKLIQFLRKLYNIIEKNVLYTHQRLCLLLLSCMECPISVSTAYVHRPCDCHSVLLPPQRLN